MESYTIFAEVYDEFMDNIPYGEWGDYLYNLLTEYGVTQGTVVDLGCGTGRITRELASRGYDMIGIDISADMLTKARSIEYDNGGDDGNILYIMQDMREFQIIGKAQAIVSICDSMNYMRDVEDLTRTFMRVRENLSDEGVFIFDMKTRHCYRDVIGNYVRTDIREDAVLIWENEYDDVVRDNMYYLTLFIESEDAEFSGLYERYEEEHIQHVFSADDVTEAYTIAGLKLMCRYEVLTHNEPNDNSERIYYVLKK